MEQGGEGDLKRVWEYFQVLNSGEAKCKICPEDPLTKRPKIIKTKNGSTSGLHTHLKLHNVVAIKRPRRLTPRDVPQMQPSPRVQITFNALQDTSLNAILARLVSLDRLSFNQIALSSDIRAGIESRLKEFKSTDLVPVGHNTIRNHVMDYAENMKNILKMTLKLHKNESTWFTLDCDEWTSVRRRRYINVNIFAKESIFWNLGLVRITGSATTEHLVELLRKRLEEFGINIATDIVALTTDGAPVAKKMARVAGVLGQLCLAHGLNLGVCDVLYKKRTSNSMIDVDEDDESDIENEEDEVFDVQTPRECSDYNADSTRTIVAKIRKMGVLFKQSVLYREKMQKYVQEKFPGSSTELQLLIDCKTRWSSMYLMLERFSKISDCVEKTLIDFESRLTVSPFDKTVVSAIEKALGPVMMTVKVLSARDCNLLQARAALKLMLLQIWRQDNRFARLLVRKMRDRITERWEISAGVLYYLHHATYVDEFPPFAAKSHTTVDDQDVDYFVDYEEDELMMTEQEILKIFSIPSKNDIKKFIVKLISRMCCSDVPVMIEHEQDESNDETGSEEVLKTFEEILSQEVKRADANLAASLPKETALSKIIANEMDVLEKNRTRGIYLEKAYSMLIAIKPTSVESERAFSSAGLVCTKIRSRLNDDTLDSVCFLRSLFKNPSATSVPLS